MSATSEIIAVRVRDLRAKRGMTLQRLADACDASKSWVWEIEQGRASNPTIDMAVRLARAFGVSLDYLTGLSTQAVPTLPTEGCDSVAAASSSLPEAERTAAAYPSTGSAENG